MGCLLRRARDRVRAHHRRDRPDFGTEPLLDSVAAAPDLATLVGEQTHLIWPGHFDMRRIAVQDPMPVYPHSLIWRRDNPHPALTMLRDYLGSGQPSHPGAATWTPSWVQPPAPPRQPAGWLSEPA